ncbi:MAG: heavy metal translocating P-type ATPase [Chloroflexi bacterium]|nr:heavy metal translocating P-type ATPase [Chloroflexota bacterium]
MTIQSANQAFPLAPPQRAAGSAQFFTLWRSNLELILAAITLIALVLGWAGDRNGALPAWAVTTAAIVAFAAGGYSGLVGAIRQAKVGKLDIDFLMIAAALGAAAIGDWKEGALLLFLFTLSGALEHFAMERTRKAIEALAVLRPDTARVRRDDQEITLSVDELKIGDLILVYPGERLPVDGVVMQGESTIDQSPITGESIPVHKTLKDLVYAGSINGHGALEVEMRKPASESTLSKIINLVEEARQNSTPAQQFIDRFSQPYTYAVISATLLAIIVPVLFGHEVFSATLYRAMTLLVVASPCALIISTPASVLSAIAAAARGGVLFKGGAYLEKVSEISTIAFDKTGTLTHGKPVVTDVRPLSGYTEHDVLRMAANAETSSEHHIGHAIIEKARALGLAQESPINFQALPGHGIQATFERGTMTETIYIGNDKLFMDEKMDISPAIRLIGRTLQEQGKTVMLVVRRSTVDDTLGDTRDWETVGFIAVADTLRPEAATAIQALRGLGIKRIVMLTGDNKAVAHGIAQSAGIDEVYSDLLPEQKVEILHQLVKEGKTIMIGDGVNDAPALATAHVGIAMGAGGTDVALETADVVLMASDLAQLPFMLDLSRRAQRIVRQNVIFSVGVIICLVLATVVLPLIIQGFVMPLPLGVVGHEGSTLLVVTNGLRMLAMRPAR